MPWKRRSACRPPAGIILCALAAAVLGGAAACFLGARLNEGVSAAAAKYLKYKSITGSYSDAEIRAALQKRAGR